MSIKLSSLRRSLNNENNLKFEDIDDQLTMSQAFKEISYLFFPFFIFAVFQFLYYSITLITLGNIYNDKLMINSMGLVFSILNFTTIGIIFGLNDSFEIIASNAYGAEKWNAFNKVFSTMRFTNLVFSSSMYIVNYFLIVGLFSMMNDSQELYLNSRKCIIILGFYPIILSQVFLLFNYLNIIERGYVNIIVQLFSIILHPVWCYVLNYRMNLGLTGAALSLIITSLLSLILLIIYIIVYPHEFIKPFEQILNLKGWKSILKYSIPFIIIQWIECSGLEIQAFIAVFLDNDSFSAYIIIFNILNVLYSVIASLEGTVIIIVSKYLTQFSSSKLKSMIYYIILFGTLICFLIELIVVAINHRILELYIKDKDVLKIAKNNFFIIPIGILLYLYNCILCTILRSLGKSFYVCIIFLFVYIFAGIILSGYFGIHLKMGLTVIYQIFIVGLIVMIISFILSFFTVNLDEARKMTFDIIDEQNKQEKIIEENFEN